ncbi:MAG: SDR family NAD(P)-dependent oxidoreductase [Novosphingobium sp.]|nr:SDR family NAD(P)-dependent oxidoreductase [Novosphingobium sp.]
MSEANLTGKVALVTGAGRGIGRQIALRLARDGADLIVHYAHSRDGAEQTAAEVKALGRKATVVQADIANRGEVIAMFAEIDRDPGRLDIVVNNSGVSDRANLATSTSARASPSSRSAARGSTSRRSGRSKDSPNAGPRSSAAAGSPSTPLSPARPARA